MFSRSLLRPAALTFALLLGLSSQSHAATFVVSSTADTEGDTCGTDCTLRQAITAANASPDYDTIVFDPTVFATKQTIEVVNTRGDLPAIKGELSITGPVTPGAGVTILDSNQGQVFCLIGETFNLANLTVKGAQQAFKVCNGNATVTGCTFTDNEMGLQNWGRQEGSASTEQRKAHPNRLFAVVEQLSNLTVTNCTVVNNFYGVFIDRGSVTLNSCTVANNNFGLLLNDGEMVLSNCLVAGNTKSNTTTIPAGACALNKDQASIITGTGTDAGLYSRGLQDNGGPTPTIALIEGSPAIGTGTSTTPSDQRGLPRGATGGSDIGAFETQPVPAKPAS